uniref:Adhesion G protein-coupled receptor B2 n=1 Tax=Sinocyclocheilus grahami TaxID=75366 RepID=A0A672KJD8_SINGR
AVPCSSLVAGVLYGSFSLRDLFPRPSALTSGCSWTVENPDPTKYSLYFRFNRHAGACLAFSPLVLPLDHYLSNQTCGPPDQPTFPSDPEAVELCMVPGPHTFLQFDKNYVQLCLTTHPNKDGDNGDGTSEGQAPLSAETLDFRLVEVLLINNENSSHFTCGVLCRWFEECLHISSGWETESCSITQTGCVCPNTAPPVSLLPTNGIAIAPRDCFTFSLISFDLIWRAHFIFQLLASNYKRETLTLKCLELPPIRISVCDKIVITDSPWLHCLVLLMILYIMF